MLFIASACKAARVPSCLLVIQFRRLECVEICLHGMRSSGEWVRVVQGDAVAFKPVWTSWKLESPLHTYICFCKQNHDMFKRAFKAVASSTTPSYSSSCIIILFVFCSYFSRLLSLLLRRFFSYSFHCFLFLFLFLPTSWLFSPIPVLATPIVHLIKIVT
jgi:hypothetical protein